MKEENEVNMKEAADNVILLDEAVFERIVGVLCEVMTNLKYKNERDKILGAIKVGEDMYQKELEMRYQKYMAMQQATKMWVSDNTGAALQNTPNPYANTASTQNQLNYQRSRLEVERARAQLEAAQPQPKSLISNRFKFW